MENTILNLLGYANDTKDEDLAELLYNLLLDFAKCANAPSDWRTLGETVAKRFKNTWIYEAALLWEFEDMD